MVSTSLIYKTRIHRMLSPTNNKVRLYLYLPHYIFTLRANISFIQTKFLFLIHIANC